MLAAGAESVGVPGGSTSQQREQTHWRSREVLNPEPIEDERTLLDVEMRVLEHFGCRVRGFGSGQEALAAGPEVLCEARIALVDAVFGGLETVLALRRINPQISTSAAGSAPSNSSWSRRNEYCRLSDRTFHDPRSQLAGRKRQKRGNFSFYAMRAGDIIRV